jgi:hypothetical protein
LATSVKGWPVTGLMFFMYCPLTGATQCPPMKFS